MHRYCGPFNQDYKLNNRYVLGDKIIFNESFGVNLRGEL